MGQTIALSNDTQLLKEQLTQHQNEKAQLQQENEQLQVFVKSLELELATISKEKTSLQQEMMARNKMLEREKQQLENDKQQLEIKQHQLQVRHQSVRNQVTQLEKEKDEIESELQGQIARLSIENMRLNGRMKQLEENEQQLQQKMRESEQLTLYCQQKEQEIVQLHQTRQQLEDNLKAKQDEFSSLQGRITAIEQSWKVNYKEVTLTKQELGRGGWGVIWIGEFRGQKVAVKQMHELIVSPEFLQLLNREIGIMAQLRHPNLLQFIGAVLDHPSGNPMIITEIMDISLRGAYEKKQLSPVPVSICLSIMRDVAVGLNYLHCLPDPIIHRDVSSANVLLESKGPGKWKTKISDFGSAKLARSAVTKAAGAEVYSAPEALQAVIEFEEELQTPKMDAYSYGILLCEVVTCQFPERQLFRGMLQQVRTQSQPLYELVASCIKKDPQDRPTMKQVIQQLDRLPH